MTQEEKAKRYDKAIKVAADIKAGTATYITDGTPVVDAIFPELKESEDERAWLINYLSNRILNSSIIAEKENLKKAITWLEKHKTSEEALQYLRENHSSSEMSDFQAAMNIAVAKAYDKGYNDGLEKRSETFTKKDIDDAYLKGVTNTKNEIEKQYEANSQIRKDIATFIFNYRGVIKDRAKWMDYLGIKVSFAKKQGEKKETLCDKCKKEQPSHSCQDITALGRCALEMQSKKKPADKVEPKFKVGDWVIDKQGIVHQIANVIENVTYHTYGYDIVGGGYFNDNTEGVRLWTIQDAKDGDVLVTKNKNIFIFKSISDCTIYDYCGLYFGKFMESSATVNGHAAVQLPTDYTPATKEQRDTLLNAMTDAGYIFDFEKKELKKIEQNMEFTDFESALFTAFSDAWQQYLHNEKVNVAQWVKEHSEELLEAVKEELKEQNPTWSDEDEQYLLICKNALAKYQVSDKWDAAIVSSWLLNKLKCPVFQQQKWSEEDEYNCNTILHHLDLRKEKYKKECNQEEQDRYQGLYDWLKSLRHQNTWKPSDEQMEALNDINLTGGVSYAGQGQELVNLYQDLKKLREE